MPYISGNYDLTLGGQDIGETRDGVHLIIRHYGEPITGDDFGQSVQEVIYLGGDVFVTFELLEYDTALAQSIFLPHATEGLIGQVGEQAVQSSNTKALLLTDINSTPAATKPATLTVPEAILAEDFDVDLLFSPRLRTVPVRMRALPNSSGAWYSVT